MEFKKNKSIYLQIADYILDNIIMERWKAGEKILSVRELASNIQVNPNTVMRSYGYLQDREIIYNKRGIGFFISENAVSKTKSLKKKQFVDSYLPEFFKNMELLEIEFSELQKLYLETKN